MTRIISLSDEVYMQLTKIKKERSFSKTIADLLKNSGGDKGVSSIRRLFGTIDKRRAKTWIKEIENERAAAGRARVF